MSKINRKSAVNIPNDPGIIFLRYDKNSDQGQLVEILKQKYKYRLNGHILELIYLSEIVGPVNLSNVNQVTLAEAYYKSSKLFFDKFEQANHKISRLTCCEIKL